MTSTLLSLDTRSLRPYKRIGEFGFNTCHAAIVPRLDLQAQIRRAHSELGMRYWRCHGTLSDDMGIVVSDGNGHPVDYAFSGLKRVLDAVLSHHVKPFLELSFMPAAFAAKPSATICYYRGITSPPREWPLWEELIRRTVTFLQETYGVEELKTWYFEVWNEPNIPFWSGTRDEYFQLYASAAHAIKAVDPHLRVGGPATARVEWVTPFLEYCRASGTPVDFLSTHIYPSDVAFAESSHGEVQLLGTEFLTRAFRRVRGEIDAISPGLPFIMGEWNSSAGPLASNHDECNNAAFVSAVLAGLEDYAEGSLFWNLSDIYEECQFHFTPFHGGYGLYTVDEVPKSAARAFEFWHRLKGERAAVHVRDGEVRAGCGCFAVFDSATGTTSAILWNHLEPGQHAEAWDVEIEAPPFSQGELSQILPGQGSAFETWQDMGRPATLKPEMLASLHAASVPRRTAIASGVPVSIRVEAGSACLMELRNY